MKKTSFHVNPAINKWEEDQRRARMEKMIQRAKSTLPPEARGAAKSSAPKKPSPYTAELNAKAAPKRSNSSQGPRPAVDAQELDGLICDRLQEILGTPLMRRAAAAKAGSPKPPQSRAGRRPLWNNDWNAQAAGSGTSWEDQPVRGAGGAGGRAPGVSPPQASGSTSGSVRRPQGTPTRTMRTASPLAVNVSPANASRQGVGRGAGDRVVLLPSPTAATPSAPGLGDPGRPISRRYGLPSGGGDGGDGMAQGHALDRSTVAAIATLNPHAPAAQEAAARLEKYTQGQQQPGGGARAAPAGRAGGGSRIPRPGGVQLPGDATAQSLQQLGSAGRLEASASVSASRGVPRGGAGDAAANQSLAPLATASRVYGASPGARRPPPALGAASHARHQHRGAALAGHARAGEGEEEEEGYDDDFEAYDGSDEEGAGALPAGEEEGEGRGAGGGEEGGHDGGRDDGGELPDVQTLRQSVQALAGLVQLRIQQELARSQHAPSHAPGATLRGSSALPAAGPATASAAATAAADPADMLASLALVGTEDDPAAADGHGGLGASGSLLDLDGLRQSDLEYLARLGGGDPHDGHGGHDAGANSGDERVFAIEPGAPAGTAKAWGDRHPWTAEMGAEATATGLELLRARQEKERLRGQEQGQGQAHDRAAAAARDYAAEDEDTVLLGETLPPNRTAAAEQMAAVGSALTALAGTGALSATEAQDLRSQTDALYGSLLQLHQLMSGPKGAELRSHPSAGNLSPDAGFNPSAATSPSDSPGNTLGRTGAAAAATTGGAAGSGGSSGRASSGSRTGTSSPLPPRLQTVTGDDDEGRGGEGGGDAAQAAGPCDGGAEAAGCGSHMQLTPRNCLVAEDIAWMAGLVASLSRSLQAGGGEAGGLTLPGL